MWRCRTCRCCSPSTGPVWWGRRPDPSGAFDISFLRTVPKHGGDPSDEHECRQMLFTGYQCNGPAAVRYPVAAAPASAESEMQALPSARDGRS